MSVAKKYPIGGILAGLALVIVGLNNDNTAIMIVGGVLIVLGVFRQLKQ